MFAICLHDGTQDEDEGWSVWQEAQILQSAVLTSNPPSWLDVRPLLASQHVATVTWDNNGMGTGVFRNHLRASDPQL